MFNSMKKSCIICIVFLLITQLVQSQNTYFTSHPSLSPDGSQIVFVYQGDIWKVGINGGIATKITSLDGEESYPHYSPDGRWIAFTSNQYGNRDVFVVPAQGGMIKQLTFHSAADLVEGWGWDSQTIYFSSNRYNRLTGYKIQVTGGTPQRLFGHFHNTTHNLAEHPNGDIYFNESFEAKTYANRKRYKGDYNPDIKSYNKNTLVYKQHTTYQGKDFATTIDKAGQVYFVSDEGSKEYNLFTFKDGKKTPLTNFNTSIYWPKVSANGAKLVFRKDYQIHVYDVATGQTTKPIIKVYANPQITKQTAFNIKGKITYFDISPDKKKLVIVARGRMFITDKQGKLVQQIETNPKEAVQEAHWLADSKTILFSQSNQGYYNWYTTAAIYPFEKKQITNDKKNDKLLAFNSDRSKAVYRSGINHFRLLDLKTWKSKVIFKGEIWALTKTRPQFSPDDRYIMFTAYDHFEQNIYLYDTQTKSVQSLMKTRVSERTPVWAPDGKRIFFAADPLNTSYPRGSKIKRIYQVWLDNYDKPFKSERIKALFATDKNENIKPTTRINYKGITERIERVSPATAQYKNPWVTQKGDKTMVFYLAYDNSGATHLWRTTLAPFKRTQRKKISKHSLNTYSFTVKAVKNTHYLLAKGHLHRFFPGSGKLEKINLSQGFTKSLSNEFLQMFYETWAALEESFYDTNFHGQDWQALRDRYAQYLPYVVQRSDLEILLNDLLGELGASHTNFSSYGKEQRTFHRYNSLETGIVWDNKNPYKVTGILKRSPADKYGKDIRPGDKLLAVQGVSIDPSQNRNQYFSLPNSQSEILLTFQRGSKKITVPFHTISYYRFKRLLYDQWQDQNQQYVDKLSNKKIAYVHLRYMGTGALNQLKREIVTEVAYKDGLILDLRYNTGGNVHDEVIQLLSRKKYFQWKYRGGNLSKRANFSLGNKPVVLLVNAKSLSDAEVLANGFKELKLGKIVGTGTYRWIIYTAGNRLVDGSFYRLPSWGCYTLDGKNLEKTGVSPDIKVDKNFKDRLDGRYPQLNKAIKVVNQLNKQ